MYQRIKRFFKRVRNLVRWFPIIWRDQDWDDWYIFEILKFKLKNQAEYIGYHDRHTTAKRDAEIMMLCVRLIEKIQEEYYGLEYFEYHKSELKFIEVDNKPDIWEMTVENISENFDEYFKKYPRIYEQVKTDDRHKTAFDIAKVNEERAHKLLFKILEQNIRRWWD